MPIIKRYEIILKGGDNSIGVSQIDGQKLIILLCQNERPEFVLIDGSCIATNMIAAVREINYGCLKIKDSEIDDGKERRELTDDEARVETMFNRLQSKKLLN